jgi:hypothetical protein
VAGRLCNSEIQMKRKRRLLGHRRMVMRAIGVSNHQAAV